MEELTSNLLRAGAIILIAIILRIIVAFAIKRGARALLARPPESIRKLKGRAGAALAKVTGGKAQERHEQRVSTMASLLRNVADVVLVLLTLLTVLSIFGIPMAPLLASAGIGGVALGFGAQSLVKDYLSGIFMLAEDQFGVGDIVTIGDISGTVEEVTLRVTRLKDFSGTVWYVRNGEILTIGNLSQGHSSESFEIPVAPDEDPDRAIEVVSAALAGMSRIEEFQDALLGDPTVLGVSGVEAGQMRIQVALTAAPNKQWAPLRAAKKRAQEALVEAGIRGPALPGAYLPKPEG